MYISNIAPGDIFPDTSALSIFDCLANRYQSFFSLAVFSSIWALKFRSSHLRCSIKKGVLKHFAKLTGNTCARVSFLTNLQASSPILLKKRLWTRCFSVKFTKLLRTLPGDSFSKLAVIAAEFLLPPEHGCDLPEIYHQYI